MTSADPAHVDHRLLEYGSAGAFVDGVMPFLFDGMKLGEPSLVVVSARHLAMLRDLLGPNKGPGIADPLAAYQPPAPAGGRCGLWLARTFSDELRVTSSDAGTAARISYSRS